ncbi:carboxylating nicotinate-nucleotide diphosphorylase [Dubosiella muris]|uniref:Carboxylating nicotinate-nucleotide diphosphorylase n=3 Tax=Dubosiella TaxID=1937008 RepID=A0AC61RA75_9FIRM|nr:carboxylating nicotinate-nucleotide diphosphorylase [Dubosiella muris]TGY66905.1 carboxylating nicotinate-nucleotide diphosphorylase [Dubosiella muris]
MNDVVMKLNADPYILSALQEDVTSEDVSTNAIMPEKRLGEAELICKQDGMICGLDVFKRVFTLLDEQSDVIFFCEEGQKVHNGQLLGKVIGDIRTILTGERTALNYLQRMSGVATATHEVVEQLQDTAITLLDTRKTTPNNRLFEKYAVKVGGGTNHRYNLSDGVLLKDNHISAAGSITKAIEMARNYAPFVRKIEIECETLEQVQEALDARADIIMLDNMDHATMKKAVERIAGRAQTEISGNVTRERIGALKDLGVDFISSGAIVYSAGILDLSLKNLHPIEGAEG